jgi:hypothetical protein
MASDELVVTRAGYKALPPVKQAAAWEQVSEGMAKEMWAEACRESRHFRRLEWASIVLQYASLACGFGSVLVLAFLAKFFVDRGAPTQAAGIFGAGAASLVGLFITSRFTVRGQRRNQPTATEETTAQGSSGPLRDPPGG